MLLTTHRKVCNDECESVSTQRHRLTVLTTADRSANQDSRWCAYNAQAWPAHMRASILTKQPACLHQAGAACKAAAQLWSKAANIPVACTGCWLTGSRVDSDAACRFWASSMLACAGAKGSRQSLVKLSSSWEVRCQHSKISSPASASACGPTKQKWLR